jgi:outer membrane protein OmpA-like peptidoglycan-associated protein
MTDKHLRRAVLAAIVALAVVPAAAQDRLTRNEIVQSLFVAENTVAALDPAALQAEAERRAAAGGANATESLAGQVAGLPQISVQINFDRGSARIRPESYYSVGLIADALHTPYLQTGRIVVVGNTDATGTRDLNLRLSKERANAVRDALTTTFQVPAARVVAIGLGEEALQDPGNPDSGVNRRVQLINLGQ